MTKPLPPVTGLSARSSLATIDLSWESLGWEPLIDHYRVYAAPGHPAAWQPRESDLVAKTVYPRFVHDGLDPAGEEWTYSVIAVSDAGRRSRPGERTSAASEPSVTATGREMARIGTFDGKSLEFRFAPSGYAKIPAAYPSAQIQYTDGVDSPDSAWPFLLPGPGDAWAGRKVYTAHWVVELSQAPSDDMDMAVWLIDTTRLGGRLEVAVNGVPAQVIELIPGATRGSREGDATLPGSTLVRSFHEFQVPAAPFVAGINTITFRLAEGGWVAWDAIGLYARV
ncbi:polysaccharide lyase family protein [Citricoccus alkalitolerans]|uniref:Polysaccharide lyase family protein n=1 Tax=Citricoccus alkalitolerans TaxID=246603 RepID=A0ABV8XWL5_9MICC